MDQTVTMEQNDWQQLIAILANAQGPGISWAAVNGLLQKIGGQLQAAQPRPLPEELRVPPLRPNGEDARS